jgi:hypothetical protein
MKSVEAEIIRDEQENENAGSNSDTQSQNINECVKPVPKEIANGNEQIILYHDGIDGKTGAILLNTYLSACYNVSNPNKMQTV